MSTVDSIFNSVSTLWSIDVYKRHLRPNAPDAEVVKTGKLAIIATLLAYRMTGEDRYAGWHRLVHGYAHQTFADREHGEWFGYVHRDGRISSPAKGNHFKGPFHLPRMQWYCWRLLRDW